MIKFATIKNKLKNLKNKLKKISPWLLWSGAMAIVGAVILLMHIPLFRCEPIWECPLPDAFHTPVIVLSLIQIASLAAIPVIVIAIMLRGIKTRRALLPALGEIIIFLGAYALIMEYAFTLILYIQNNVCPEASGCEYVGNMMAFIIAMPASVLMPVLAFAFLKYKAGFWNLLARRKK
ncbi:MAG: hypothetical protein FWD15_01255 [Alphaproteobacteria bacterium]|nr:hypothetical protein [Alphaproteobacteria bacterium]